MKRDNHRGKVYTENRRDFMKKRKFKKRVSAVGLEGKKEQKKEGMGGEPLSLKA